MKILMLTDGIYPFVIGGMQKHAYYLAKHLLLNDIDLTIYHCISENPNPKIDKDLKNSLGIKESMNFNSKCFKFPKFKISFPCHYLIESYKYSKTLYNEIIKEKKDFDFIYAKGFSGWYSIIKQNDLPNIGVQFHGLEMFQKSSSFLNYLEKIILRLPVKYNLRNANFIFSYGAKIKSLHEKIGCDPQKIFIQHGGISSDLIINKKQISNNNKTHFLFIGRDERRKGYRELLKALKILVHKKNFHFSFIGEIPESQKLVSSKITYFGIIKNQDDYIKIIDKNDIIVVPSISEGLPTVLLESMARGLAALATDVGAINEIVNNENGYLIKHSNVEEIINVMEIYIDLPKSILFKKKIMALETVEKKFKWEKLSKEFLKFIKENN